MVFSSNTIGTLYRRNKEDSYIRGRNIRDCIRLASKAVNLLHKKAYSGNLALKIDISKAFDTLE
jgi:hypothetical protein